MNRVEEVEHDADAAASQLINALSHVLGNTVVLLGVLDGKGGMYFIPHPQIGAGVFDYLAGVNWTAARRVAEEFLT